MKKVQVYLMSALVAAALLQGCGTREVVAPTVTNANEHPNGLIQNRIIYTVHVISSSVIGNAREAGLANAQVTVSQNGRASTKTVNESGIAIFDDLYEGSITVFVKADGHASINQEFSEVVGIVDVNQNGNNSNQNVILSYSNIITLPRLNGALQGRFVLDTDADDRTSPVAAAGLKVRLKYASTIEPNEFFATTDSDGIFKFFSVPGVSSDMANPTLSVESSFTLGAGEELQYFKLSVPELGPVTPKPFSVGSVFDLGTSELDLSASKIFFTGIISGSLFGDFTFVDKSRLRAASNDVSSDDVIGTFPFSISPRFSLVSDNAYTFVGTGGLSTPVANQFIDSLYADQSPNLDTIPALGSVAYGLYNNESFTVSIIGLGGFSRLPAFSSANYIATDIDLTLTMTTIPGGYIGKTEFKTTVGSDGKYSFTGLPLGATYELKAEKFVTVVIPGTGTEKRVKFQLTDNSAYVVEGASFTPITPSSNVVKVSLGATQTSSEDLGILELKYGN